MVTKYNHFCYKWVASSTSRRYNAFRQVFNERIIFMAPLILVNRIQEIRARLERATLGPWTPQASRDLHGRRWFTLFSDTTPIAQICEDPNSTEGAPSNAERDAEFISHATDDIRFLLSVLDSRLLEQAIVTLNSRSTETTSTVKQA